MRGARFAVIGGLSAMLLLGACGGGDDDDSSSASSTTKAPPTTTSTAAGGASSGGSKVISAEVPDPCTLVPTAQLEADLGALPGTGSVQSVDPRQRKVCNWSSGLIMAIEVADHYDATIDAIRDNAGSSTITDLPGVGNAAIWQDFGNGVGQVVAQGDTYMVGVTVRSGGQAPALTIAKEMLELL